MSKKSTDYQNFPSIKEPCKELSQADYLSFQIPYIDWSISTTYLKKCIKKASLENQYTFCCAQNLKMRIIMEIINGYLKKNKC